MSDNDNNPYGEFKIPGCTDNSALNYNKNATEDDGTCEYPEIEKPIVEINDFSKLKRLYQIIIASLVFIFITILVIILLNKNKNKNIIKDVEDEPFVIYLN
jgi:hypothetical protein